MALDGKDRKYRIRRVYLNLLAKMGEENLVFSIKLLNLNQTKKINYEKTNLCSLMGLIITSCNKETEDFSNLSLNKNQDGIDLLESLDAEVKLALENVDQRSAINVDPENTENPYDEVGKLHNQGLDYIKSKYDANSNYTAYTSEVCTGKLCDNLVRKMVGLSLEFVFSELGRKNVFSFEELIVLVNEAQQINPEEFDVFLANKHANGVITELEESILNKYTGLMFNLKNNLNAFITVSKIFERQIAASNISEDEKIRLLMTISVGKWSGYYWDSNLGDEDSPTQRVRWWRVALADIGGALIGVATGLGLDLPGATDLESATIGGVTCGAAASAIERENEGG